MKRIFLAVAVLICATSLHATTVGCSDGSSFCYGHIYTAGNAYPYFEDIDDHDLVNVDGTETLVHSTCANVPGDATSPTKRELRSSGAFNVIIRAYIRIDAVISAPAGARYGLKIYVDGVERGGATRFIRMHPDSTSALLPQGDWFNASVQNLSSGNHYVEVKAYMVDGGHMKIGLSWITGQGAPAAYPSGRSVNAASATIGSSWTQITDTLRIDNNSGETIAIYPQAYFQFQGGTPGDHIQVGFGLKAATSGTWPSSAHNSDFNVACPLKDGSGNCYWPTVDTARDGINIADDILSVPTGSWDLTLFAKNMDGHNTTVGYRQIEYISFPASAGVSASKYATDTVDVNPGGSTDQPLYAETNTCGRWTKLLTINATTDLPSSTGDSDWVGEGYIEFVQRGTSTHTEGQWAAPDVEVLLESTGQGLANDFGGNVLSLSRDRRGYYFQIDAGRWGNTNNGTTILGNTLTLWVRKRSGANCAFTQCQSRPASGDAYFTVGKRYMSVKLVPSGSCIQPDTDPSQKPAGTGNCQ